MATSKAFGEKTPLMKTKGAVRNLSQQFFKLRNPSLHQEVSSSIEDNTRLRYIFTSSLYIFRFQPLKSTFLNSLSSSSANIYYGGHMPTEGGTYSGVTSP
jgi:hypothetical protein